MIRTKEDLKYYLNEDKKHMIGSNMFIKWLTFSDDYMPYLILKCLRYYEYYLNKKKYLWDYIPYLWYWWNFRRLKVKTQSFIYPNTLGAGISFMHPGFRRLAMFSHIGEHCTVLPNVLIGRKSPGIEADVYIGDNCYISTGVTILGPVKIGNNVTIGAGAVVTKDIPDNAVVGGVPAKVLRMK